MTQLNFNSQYENYIGGKWVAPIDGGYFDNISSVNGSVLNKVPQSNHKDIEAAIQAADQAADSWGKTSAAERSNILFKVAERIENNLEELARLETWENGKAIRETLNADLPLVVDHFRYFGAVIRSEAGDISDLDANTVSMEVHEPLGVVGQIIPWNFPLLMATWKIAPALAAGNCIILKPAEQTPSTILVLMELVADLFPDGVINVVSGFGPEAGKPLASHPNIKKIAFTGETTTGRLILQYASENITPVSLELGGKSPNVFFESVMSEDDSFLDKAVEGFVMFALNQGEVCTCPSRALVQESIYNKFMDRCLKRVEAIKMGDPLAADVMMGAQVSKDQYNKILNYIDIGKQEGADVLIGGEAYDNSVHPNGFYIKPTVFSGNNNMRIFQEEIFGPVVGVTTFKDEAEAIKISNDTLYGLGAGVWTRDLHQMQNLSRAIAAGRIWCNCFHAYPAHASFGGYKKSGIGRETHKMMLDHYRHTKNVLISYDKNPLGFF